MSLLDAPAMAETGRIFVGIDPGVSTGWALMRDGKLLECETLSIHAAFFRVLKLATPAHPAADKPLITVYFEDARLRSGYFGPNSRAKAQGAGSVKRDCSAWEDFLTDHGIHFVPVSPRAKGVKRSAQWLKQVTGWVARTSEHGRDAATLIVGRT